MPGIGKNNVSPHDTFPQAHLWEVQEAEACTVFKAGGEGGRQSGAAAGRELPPQPEATGSVLPTGA